MKLDVSAICIGQPKPYRGDERSAFAKEPATGTLHIHSEGFTGDAQADRKHHGGPHMAIHLYPRAHHAFWDEHLGGHDLLALPGAFGSNLSVDGVTEEDVLLGDRFRLGSAVLEVSQPRMPCWKIEHRFGQKGMVAKIIQSGICGWYFRVVEEGDAEAGTTLERIETGRTPWSIDQVFLEIANPKAETSAERLQAMAGCELLSPVWREGAKQKAKALA